MIKITLAGVVTASGVTRHEGLDSDVNVQRSFIPEVLYTQEAAGATQTGDRLNVADAPTFDSRAKAERSIAAYPAGAAVKVKVTPRTLSVAP